MRRPVAVLISDIHYSLPTLELADAALRQAVAKANDLKRPLVIAGDLHDTKADLRGECVERILDTLALLNSGLTVIVGNHDLINERSDKNALEFLRNQCFLIRSPKRNPYADLYYIPYYSNVDKLRTYLKALPDGAMLIMHQGLESALPGDYTHDKSALSHADVARFRVISGHYHNRQDIKTGPTGLFSYIGNPYTLNFAEANDLPKGFQVLHDDRTLEFVSTNLRKHVVYDLNANNPAFNGDLVQRHAPGDLVWVKLSGTRDFLSTPAASKQNIGRLLCLGDSFRFDKYPTNAQTETPRIKQSQELTLDGIIDTRAGSSKQRLKDLWRSYRG